MSAVDPIAVALVGAGVIPLLYATDGLIGQELLPTYRGGGGMYMSHRKGSSWSVEEIYADDEDIEVIIKAFIERILL